MKITVRFFASLREQLGDPLEPLELPSGSSIQDAWDHLCLGETLTPPQTLCAVNQNYADLGDELHDGDEVAFFPPVTGG